VVRRRWKDIPVLFQIRIFEKAVHWRHVSIAELGIVREGEGLLDVELLETCLPMLCRSSAPQQTSPLSPHHYPQSHLYNYHTSSLSSHTLVLIAYPYFHLHPHPHRTSHPHPQQKSPYPRISGCLGHPGSSRQYTGSFKAPAPRLPDSRLPGVSKVSQSGSGSGTLSHCPLSNAFHSSFKPCLEDSSPRSTKKLLPAYSSSLARCKLNALSVRVPQVQMLQAPSSEG
jgi:hypothetical protein